MGGGAWPFLVGGVICLVNSVNERDLNLLTSGVGLPARVKRSVGRWVRLPLSRPGILGQFGSLLRGTIYA